jgi:predicted DsbA family dithiol-disulfide isomerase
VIWALGKPGKPGHVAGMRIDVFFDVVCPWCLIGKRRLESALSSRPDVTPEIAWQPFQLNPDMPQAGMPRQSYLEAKFGGPSRAKQIYGMIRETAARSGIHLDIDRIERTPNTLDAHRLVRWRQLQGADDTDALVDRLFTAYFQEGDDVGDRQVLVRLAGEVGIDAQEAEAFLASDAEAQAVQTIDKTARQMGIQGVPCFVFDQHYALSGAQEPQAFFPVFDLAANGGAPAQP